MNQVQVKSLLRRDREKYMFASMSDTNELAAFIRVIERLKPKKKE